MIIPENVSNVKQKVVFYCRVSNKENLLTDEEIMQREVEKSKQLMKRYKYSNIN